MVAKPVQEKVTVESSVWIQYTIISKNSGKNIKKYLLRVKKRVKKTEAIKKNEKVIIKISFLSFLSKLIIQIINKIRGISNPRKKSLFL